MSPLSINFYFFIILIYVTSVYGQTSDPNILGMRLEKTDGKISYNEEGIITIEAGVDTRIQFLGVGLEKGSIIKFTTEKMHVPVGLKKWSRRQVLGP